MGVSVQLASTREYLLEEREAAERRESHQSFSGVRHSRDAEHAVRMIRAPQRRPAKDQKICCFASCSREGWWQSVEGGGMGAKERARFDAAFLQKVLDVKRRLQDTRCACVQRRECVLASLPLRMPACANAC